MDPTEAFRSLLRAIGSKGQAAFKVDRMIWDRGPINGLRIPGTWEEMGRLHGELMDMVPGLPEDQRSYWEATLPSISILMDMIGGTSLELGMVLERMFRCPSDLPARREVVHLREAIASDLIGELHEDEMRPAVLAWEGAQVIPEGEVLRLARRELQSLRIATARSLSLPPQRVVMRGTTGVPWTGYSDYTGGGRSKIYINTDMRWPRAMLRNLVAHEGYPGHHTHAVLMEASAVAKRAPPETTIWFLGSPFTPVSEGLAEHGTSTLGWPRRGDRLAFHLTMLRWAISMEVLARGRTVAGDAPMVERLCQEGLMDEITARQTLAFLSNPLLGPSSFCYWYGTWAVRDGYNAAVATLRRQEFLAWIYGAPRTLPELMAWSR